MDPNIQTILLGLLVNGLTAFIAQFGHKDSKLLIGEELLKKIKWEESALHPILQKATQAVSEGIEWQRLPKLEIVCLFLNSPEVEAIVRQIYAAKLSLREEREDLVSIRREFLTSFYLYTTSYSSYEGLREDQLADSSNILLDTLIEGCELALNAAIDNGILSAHEAKSAFRHHIMLNELAALRENVAFLTSQQRPNVKAILDFEKKYRLQLGNRHGYIIPPYFDRARKIPIDDLYVSPHFVTLSEDRIKSRKVINLLDLLSIIHRVVILGNPGSGKSTFTSKLCFELATHHSERLFARRKDITPILVVLRDYGDKKKSHDYSILQFIETKARSDYQVEPPLGAFEYLLRNGRAIVIFDGLDELLDTNRRQEISKDVESFCTRYPSVPVLVTSREVGYEQAPLDERSFEVFGLNPFKEEQVQEYVTKWFNSDTDLTTEQRNQKTESFLEESSSVPDLRSNPLMLALMCNIYRGENYIPRNRPEVYEKCATMLFDRWDKSRGIYVTLPVDWHISPMMKYLAYWIYTGKGLREGVTESQLITKAKEYLLQRRFEDSDEAEMAACQFIDFCCKGRAWVFTDTGTTREGERLYQFTHSTFLEYFTAAYLERTCETIHSLITVLLPKITKREWDVVAQLAFQLRSKSSEDAGDRLLITLIEQADKTFQHQGESSESFGDRLNVGDGLPPVPIAQALGTGAGWNLMSFAARCLEFIVPSPKVTRAITKVCIDRFLGLGLESQMEGLSEEKAVLYESNSTSEIIGSLLCASNENRVPIADSIEKLLTERINKGSESEAILALEFGLELSIYIPHQRRGQDEVYKFWNEISDRIRTNCFHHIEMLLPKSVILCYESLFRGQVRIPDLIRWHGAESMFYAYKFPLLMAYYSPLAEVYIASILKNEEKWLDKLKDVNLVLTPSCSLPWIKKKRTSRENFLTSLLMEMENKKLSDSLANPLNLDSQALFGAFVLFAVFLELEEDKLETKKLVQKLVVTEEEDKLETQKLVVIEEIKKSRLPFFNLIRMTFYARFEEVPADKVQAEMDGCGFTTDQQGFVWRWIRREANLVEVANLPT